MAPVFSRPQQTFAAALVFVAMAAGEVCAATNTTCPAPFANLTEPNNWAVHQLCWYPRLNVCRSDRSTGYMEDQIRVFYDKWDEKDPRRQFIELEFFTTAPDFKDPGAKEYDLKVQGWMEPIYNLWYELYQKDEEQEKLHPGSTKSPLMDVPEDVNMDEITGFDICCPPEFPCMISRQFKKPYCYNANTTSYLMTEKWDPKLPAGILNINEFTYTRRDGEVFDFVPASLKVDTKISGNASLTISSTQGPQPTNVHKNVTTSGVTLTSSVNATFTQTHVHVNTTTPEPTESGSVGSKVFAKVGTIPFFGAIAPLVFAGLGAFLVL